MINYIQRGKDLHSLDLALGFGEVYLPEVLARKYINGAVQTGWQYVFPSQQRSRDDPRTGTERRYQVLLSGLQKAVRKAARDAGMDKRVTVHTLGHFFATHLLEKNGINIRVLQELLGHADVKNTEIYTHVMKKDIDTVGNPLELLYSR